MMEWNDSLVESRISEMQIYLDYWIAREQRMRIEGRSEDADVSHHWARNCERALARLRSIGEAA